jgi:hypothetical protein
MEKSEDKIQQQIVMWFRNAYCLKHHVPRCAIFSVPNDGKNIKEQMRKRATGLMAGVSDLIVVLPEDVIFVEVKDEKGKQSDKQLEFEKTMIALDKKYLVVRSLEEFKELFTPLLFLA